MNEDEEAWIHEDPDDGGLDGTPLEDYAIQPPPLAMPSEGHGVVDPCTLETLPMGDLFMPEPKELKLQFQNTPNFDVDDRIKVLT